MRWGEQYRYCPNCGKQHYDGNIQMNHVMSMCCDEKCRSEWNMKYARCILGQHDTPPNKEKS